MQSSNVSYKFKGVFLLNLALLFFCTFPIIAQKIFLLKNEKIDFVAKNYFIEKVIDKRPSTNSLGIVFDQNLQKNVLNLNGGAAYNLINFISKNLVQNKGNSSTIILKIKELSINETLKNGGMIDGKCFMTLQFQKVVAGDTVTIIEPKSNYAFSRSTNNFNVDYYEKIVRQMTTTCLNYFNKWHEKNATKSEAFAHGSRVVLLPEIDNSDEDTLYFVSRKLNWSDFKGVPPQRTQFAAAVYPSIGFQAHFTIKNGFIEAQILPQVYVVRGMSWMKNDARNAYTLAHEQVHFNIAKIVLEHFKQKILTIEASTVADLNSRIQYEYLEAFREMNKLQEAYDGESNHGINEAKQHEWAEKIEKELLVFSR